MSGLKMVTLKDGYRIQEDVLVQITNKLENAFKDHRLAFNELWRKCNDPSHKLEVNCFVDSKTILREYKLIDENDGVPERVRKVVLNSVISPGVLTSPIKNAGYISLSSAHTFTALAVVTVVGGLGIAYLKRLWR